MRRARTKESLFARHLLRTEVNRERNHEKRLKMDRKLRVEKAQRERRRLVALAIRSICGPLVEGIREEALRTVTKTRVDASRRNERERMVAERERMGAEDGYAHHVRGFLACKAKRIKRLRALFDAYVALIFTFCS